MHISIVQVWLRLTQSLVEPPNIIRSVLCLQIGSKFSTLKPPKTSLRPLWTPSNILKLKYNIIFMMIGQIKLKICGFTTSDEDVKMPPENPLTHPRAPLRL